MTRPLFTALTILPAILVAGCFPELPLGSPGHRDYQSFGRVPIPGGAFNAAALNARFENEAFSIDTKVGPGKSFGQVWNTGTRRWHGSWEMSFDGATFVDALGTVHDVEGVAHGSAIPGTWWVVVDADTVKTKGGLTYHFDAQGRLAAETWSRDGFPQLSYLWSAGGLQLEECVSASQQQAGACRLLVSLDEGASGVEEIVDEVSADAGVDRRALYDYDGQGRIAEAKTPRQVAQGFAGTRYEYDGANRLTAQVLPDGERIEYAYAQTHLLEVRRLGAQDPSTRFDYVRTADGGWEVTHTNPLGGRTLYTSTSAGEVTRIERIDLDVPEVMTIQWHAGLLRPFRVRGFDGAATEFHTWVDDDPGEIVESSGNTLLFAYAPDAVNHADATARPVQAIVDDLGPVASVVHDPVTGLPVSWMNGAAEASTFAHVAGNLVNTRTPWGDTTDFQSFGAAGHWRKAVSSAVPEVTIRRKFDRVGNPLVPAAGLQRGGVLESAWDRDRRLASMQVAATDAEGLVVSTGRVDFGLRADGRPLAISRPLGADHELEYDALGRPVRVCERVEGQCNDTVLAHDAAGRPISIERANGMREELDYDLYGRVVARRALRAGALEGEATFLWEAGRMVEASDSLRGDTRTLAYDGAGRLASETHSAHGEIRVLQYDLRSRLVRETFVAPPGGVGGSASTLTLGYDYDGADRLVRLFVDDGSPGGELLRENVIVDGRTVEIRDGNGAVREPVFDAGTHRLVGFRMTDAAAALVEDTTIERGVELAPTRYQVRSETWTPLATTAEEYWLNRPGSLLDPNGKVGMRIFRDRGWDDGVLVRDRSWAWDALSNVQGNAAGDAFDYNADRTRLLAASGSGWSHDYAYDAAGFVTSRDGLEIAWTATGRVARVGPPGLPLVEARWDLSGGLVAVQADGEYREFSWFGGRIEHDPVAGGPGWLHVGAVSLSFTGSERRYRHADFRGNTALVTDESAAVVSHRRHHAFGLAQVHGSSGSGGASLLEQLVLSGFAGGVAAQDAALGFTGARVLDYDTGRFLSPDPLLHVLNQVTYAVGNPVLFEDASGLQEAVAEARYELSVKAHTTFAFGIIVVGTAIGSAAVILFGSVYLLGVHAFDTYHSAEQLDAIESQQDAGFEAAPSQPEAKSLAPQGWVSPREKRPATGDFQVESVTAASSCAPLALLHAQHVSLRFMVLSALCALAWCTANACGSGGRRVRGRDQEGQDHDRRP